MVLALCKANTISAAKSDLDLLTVNTTVRDVLVHTPMEYISTKVSLTVVPDLSPDLSDYYYVVTDKEIFVKHVNDGYAGTPLSLGGMHAVYSDSKLYVLDAAAISVVRIMNMNGVPELTLLHSVPVMSDCNKVAVVNNVYVLNCSDTVLMFPVDPSPPPQPLPAAVPGATLGCVDAAAMLVILFIGNNIAMYDLKSGVPMPLQSNSNYGPLPYQPLSCQHQDATLYVMCKGIGGLDGTKNFIGYNTTSNKPLFAHTYKMDAFCLMNASHLALVDETTVSNVILNATVMDAVSSLALQNSEPVNYLVKVRNNVIVVTDNSLKSFHVVPQTLSSGKDFFPNSGTAARIELDRLHEGIFFVSEHAGGLQSVKLDDTGFVTISSEQEATWTTVSSHLLAGRLFAFSGDVTTIQTYLVSDIKTGQLDTNNRATFTSITSCKRAVAYETTLYAMCDIDGDRAHLVRFNASGTEPTLINTKLPVGAVMCQNGEHIAVTKYDDPEEIILYLASTYPTEVRSRRVGYRITSCELQTIGTHVQLLVGGEGSKLLKVDLASNVATDLSGSFEARDFSIAAILSVSGFERFVLLHNGDMNLLVFDLDEEEVVQNVTIECQAMGQMQIMHMSGGTRQLLIAGTDRVMAVPLNLAPDTAAPTPAPRTSSPATLTPPTAPPPSNVPAHTTASPEHTDAPATQTSSVLPSTLSEVPIESTEPMVVTTGPTTLAPPVPTMAPVEETEVVWCEVYPHTANVEHQACRVFGDEAATCSAVQTCTCGRSFSNVGSASVCMELPHLDQEEIFLTVRTSVTWDAACEQMQETLKDTITTVVHNTLGGDVVGVGTECPGPLQLDIVLQHVSLKHVLEANLQAEVRKRYVKDAELSASVARLGPVARTQITVSAQCEAEGAEFALQAALQCRAYVCKEGYTLSGMHICVAEGSDEEGVLHFVLLGLGCLVCVIVALIVWLRVRKTRETANGDSASPRSRSGRGKVDKYGGDNPHSPLHNCTLLEEVELPLVENEVTSSEGRCMSPDGNSSWLYNESLVASPPAYDLTAFTDSCASPKQVRFKPILEEEIPRTIREEEEEEEQPTTVIRLEPEKIHVEDAIAS